VLISDIVENQGSWRNNLRAFGRGFGQELARRYAPDIEFAKRAAPSAVAAPAVTAPQSTVTQPTAPVTAQTPVAAATTAPVATAATPQPAAAKPRVLAQPIRVGNKVYRPGDAMHAQLSQMIQAQQQS
jgi:cytoskeletal protein RodZ